MCKIICVTDRKACCDDFLTRIEQIAVAKPEAIILREKDLSEEAYRKLAYSCKAICDDYNVPLWLNGHIELAVEMGCGVQVGFMLHEALNHVKNGGISCGISIHSVLEARQLEEHRALHFIAGHIFPTQCKPGLPPRGLEFLKQLCSTTKKPVYAIGGITPERFSDVIAAGATGACVMNGLMTCQNPATYLDQFRL